MPKNENNKKGILNAPPKTTFVIGLLTGVVACSILGVILSLTVVKSMVSESDNTDKVAGVEDQADAAAPAEESALSAANISKYAGEINLNIDDFNNCMANSEKATKVASDQQEGVDLGVNGTPATFINGYLISGALPSTEFDTIIDEILAGKRPTSQYVSEADPIDYKITEEDSVKGNGSKLTFIEFSDFECPYCTRHAATMEQLYEKYGDQGKFIFKHFPLSFHENAQLAAEASECAADQGKFWEMHNKMFGL